MDNNNSVIVHFRFDGNTRLEKQGMKDRWNVFVVGLIFIWSGIKIMYSAIFEVKGFAQTVKSLHELFDNFTTNLTTNKEKAK